MLVNFNWRTTCTRTWKCQRRPVVQNERSNQCALEIARTLKNVSMRVESRKNWHCKDDEPRHAGRELIERSCELYRKSGMQEICNFFYFHS